MIVSHPDPLLRQPCLPVEDFGLALRRLVTDLRGELAASARARWPGFGLAAPQIGVPLRVFVLGAAPFVNPVLVSCGGEIVEADEGCLSLPHGELYRVGRYPMVEVSACGLDGIETVRRLSGMAARCAQHELDHLDGVMVCDRGSLPHHPNPVVS